MGIPISQFLETFVTFKNIWDQSNNWRTHSQNVSFQLLVPEIVTEKSNRNIQEQVTNTILLCFVT